MVGDAEAIGLARLRGRVRHVHDETLCFGESARDLRHQKARAHRREQASGPERDEVSCGDRFHAAIGRANVVVFEVDALDRRLARGAHVDLFFDDAAVGELGAQMGVIEGHRENAPADLQEARRFLDGTKERSLLLRERGEEEVAEGHAVELLALIGLEPMREEPHQRRIALGEDRQRAPDVAGCRHVERDAHLAR